MYFTMDTLNQIHFLYQYSLKFFLDIFSSALLSNEKLKTVTDYAARLNIITKDLFVVSKRKRISSRCESGRGGRVENSEINYTFCI